MKERNQEAELEPLPAHERRIIHSALSDDPDISTYSEGDEPHRRIVISPTEIVISPCFCMPFLPYNRVVLGVIGVDLVDVVSGCEPRRRGPRKKRQNNKREHSTVRARSLRAATSASLLLAEKVSGRNLCQLTFLRPVAA